MIFTLISFTAPAPTAALLSGAPRVKSVIGSVFLPVFLTFMAL